MKFVRTILIIISLLVIIIVGSLSYMNFFQSVHVEEKEEGGYMVAGVNVTGPYSKAGRHIEEVDRQLKEMNILSARGIGIYYDDPKTIPSEQCRSFVGNIIDKNDLSRISDIRQKGLKIDSIPLTKGIVVEFPLKNMMSYMVGPIKVYPVLSNYLREKNYNPLLFFEIYDTQKRKITYVIQYALENAEDKP